MEIWGDDQQHIKRFGPADYHHRAAFGVGLYFFPRKTVIGKHRWIGGVYVLALFLAAGVYATARLGWLEGKQKLMPIHNQTFDSQLVKLDGKSFYQCTFKNVTVLWNGGPYLIAESKLISIKRLETENQTISATIGLLSTFHALSKGAGIVHIPNDVVEHDSEQ